MPDLSYKNGAGPGPASNQRERLHGSGDSPQENVFSYLTLADKVLIAVLLLVSVFSYAMVKSGLAAGAYASVSVDNKETVRIRLDTETRTFNFQSAVGPVVVERKNSRVRMLEASCPNKICIKMGWIDNSGGMIVCAPGKVLILIAGEEKNSLDALTR